MATNLSIIKAAMQMLGILNELETPSAEQGELGLTVLNDMLEDWDGRGIDIGQWPQTDYAAEFPGPTSVEGVCKANLAIWLTAYYPGSTVPPAVIALASSGYNRLLRDAIIEQCEPADMSHMPGLTDSYSILEG
jgi:hypothetical protein